MDYPPAVRVQRHIGEYENPSGVLIQGAGGGLPEFALLFPVRHQPEGDLRILLHDVHPFLGDPDIRRLRFQRICHNKAGLIRPGYRRVITLVVRPHAGFFHDFVGGGPAVDRVRQGYAGSPCRIRVFPQRDQPDDISPLLHFNGDVVRPESQGVVIVIPDLFNRDIPVFQRVFHFKGGNRIRLGLNFLRRGDIAGNIGLAHVKVERFRRAVRLRVRIKRHILKDSLPVVVRGKGNGSHPLRAESRVRIQIQPDAFRTVPVEVILVVPGFFHRNVHKLDRVGNGQGNRAFALFLPVRGGPVPGGIFPDGIQIVIPSRILLRNGDDGFPAVLLRQAVLPYRCLLFASCLLEKGEIN